MPRALMLIILLTLLSSNAQSALNKESIIIPHYSSLKYKNERYGKNSLLTNNLALKNRKRFIKQVDGASCAVVAASSNLIGSNYGEVIDSHDIVFRPNLTPTDNFEKDVGTKTTIRFFNSSDHDENFYKSNEFTNIDLNKSEYLFLYNHIPTWTIKGPYKEHIDKIVTWSAYDIYNLIGEEKTLGITNYSSGIKTLAIALSICGKIDVYGYGEDYRGHMGYYDKNFNFGKNKLHSPNQQQAFIYELAKQKQINLFMGNAQKNTPALFGDNID